MTTADLIKTINTLLAGEMLQYEELETFLDSTIDDINTTLNSTFPAFSELRTANNSVPTQYNLFPDRYVRTVVAKGAAAKFYTSDEEGVQSALTYENDYRAALFYMQRDYGAKVPEEYSDITDTAGSYPNTDEFSLYSGGVTV